MQNNRKLLLSEKLNFNWIILSSHQGFIVMLPVSMTDNGSWLNCNLFLFISFIYFFILLFLSSLFFSVCQTIQLCKMGEHLPDSFCAVCHRVYGDATCHFPILVRLFLRCVCVWIVCKMSMTDNLFQFLICLVLLNLSCSDDLEVCVPGSFTVPGSTPFTTTLPSSVTTSSTWCWLSSSACTSSGLTSSCAWSRNSWSAL